MAAHRSHGMKPNAWRGLPAVGFLGAPELQDVIRHRRRGRLLVEILLMNAGRMSRDHQPVGYSPLQQAF